MVLLIITWGHTTKQHRNFMRKILIALMASSMLLPSVTLASSIRPGSKTNIETTRSRRKPTCLVEEKWEKCEVIIDETGVTHPIGKITNVVSWKTEEKDFSYGGAVVGGAAGAGAGFAAGLGTCMVIGPLCLITAPAMMGAGMGGGAEIGGKGTGRFFTVVGDDAEGNRLIQEFRYGSGKSVRKAQKELLMSTKLVEGEVK